MKQETQEARDLIGVKDPKANGQVCFKNLSDLKLKNLQSLFRNQKVEDQNDQS